MLYHVENNPAGILRWNNVDPTLNLDLDVDSAGKILRQISLEHLNLLPGSIQEIECTALLPVNCFAYESWQFDTSPENFNSEIQKKKTQIVLPRHWHIVTLPIYPCAEVSQVWSTKEGYTIVGLFRMDDHSCMDEYFQEMWV
jgi:hypothetical protein